MDSGCAELLKLRVAEVRNNEDTPRED